MSHAVDEKVAIITGAGTGMGRALALMLAESGFRVALVGRREEPLRETADRIGELAREADRALVIAADIGDPAGVQSLVETVTAKWGRIDAVVNNAGLASQKPIGRMDLETIQDAFRVNAIGPAYLITLCWKYLEASGEGVVVNVSTKGTTDPFNGFFAYAGSKGSVNVLSKSVANEGKRKNVRGFTVAPGATETGMLRSMFDEKIIPRDATMSPEAVAGVMYDCITGKRDTDNGKVILLQQEGGAVKERVLS